jgi:hypothetical protein
VRANRRVGQSRRSLSFCPGPRQCGASSVIYQPSGVSKSWASGLRSVSYRPSSVQFASVRANERSIINHDKIPLCQLLVLGPGCRNVAWTVTAQVEGTPACRRPDIWCLLFLRASELVLSQPALRPVRETFNSQQMLDLRQPRRQWCRLTTSFPLRPSAPQPVLMYGWQCSSGHLLTVRPLLVRPFALLVSHPSVAGLQSMVRGIVAPPGAANRY